MEEYYVNQVTHKGEGPPPYHGTRIQRGHGVGGFFLRMFKQVVPFLKDTVKTLGKEAAKTGLGIAQDALQGRDIKKSAVERTKKSASSLVDRASTLVESQPNGTKTVTKTKSTTKKSQKTRKRKNKTSKTSKKSGKAKKKKKEDAFGEY